jgi:hypothetical protein
MPLGPSSRPSPFNLPDFPRPCSPAGGGYLATVLYTWIHTDRPGTIPTEGLVTSTRAGVGGRSLPAFLALPSGHFFTRIQPR